VALDGVSLVVGRGEIVALLGPNGGGKSTLFRILSTLQRPTAGTARILGHDVVAEPDAVRRHLGVVFQHPSVDGKLTVEENLLHHGALYGLGGRPLRERVERALRRIGLWDRRRDRVDRLSGGLQRRTELAKVLLPSVEVLLLDEPSTGLDPGARRDFLTSLRELRDEDGITVVLTTHDMDEAERCDRIGIVDRGRLVALGTAEELKARVGGDVLVLQTAAPEALRDAVQARFGLPATVVDGVVRLERARGHELVPQLVEAFPAEIRAVSFGKPTLEDVFVTVTGHRWADATEEVA
jgi:ABC-2 type transport system ATP-binding protein